MADKPKVFITRNIPDQPLQRSKELFDVEQWEDDWNIPRDDLLKAVQGKDGVMTLLTEKVDDEFLDAAGPQLKIVANFAVGFDNIDVEACTRRGVLASNTPEVLSETTADLAFSLLVSAGRRIAEGDRFLRAKTPWIWGPLMMQGQDVYDSTLGIVGFGRIGQAVARRGKKGFNQRIIYYDVRRASKEVEDELGAEFREFDDLLHEADFISIHVALTPETKHLFGADQFKKMKKTAVVVNTSRGPVIDEGALAKALQEGEVWAAGLDVFEKEPQVHEELLKCENAVVIPHLGSASYETRIAMGQLATDNLESVLIKNQPGPTLLNPDVWKG
ncbi:MAG: D-glycerate dehydrogenase [Actinomycetota bacterium]